MNLKNKLITFTFLGFTAALLGGCVRSRTVSFPDHSYDAVFKSAVTGLCKYNDKMFVYEANKKTGLIKLETRSVWGNTIPQVFIYGASGGTPSITVRGNDTWLENIITANLPKEKTGTTKSPGKKTLQTESDDLQFEKQKLELEKEKLKFEREKLEFEKQKLKKE